MKIGEVCLLTGDVVRLANFYKELFGVDNGSDDAVHQFILPDGGPQSGGETSLTIYNDGGERTGGEGNLRLAFTVPDVDAEAERLRKLGVPIVDPPTVRPWGAKNMTFYDPDGNLVTFRSFPKE